MRIAYLDCIGGISGDMMLGALIDAGADVNRLVEGLRTLDLPPWELQVGSARKSGIAAATIEVAVRGQAAGAAPLLRVPPSDAPLTSGSHTHTHTHEHGHTHSQEHSHESGYRYSYQPHAGHTHEDPPTAGAPEPAFQP